MVQINLSGNIGLETRTDDKSHKTYFLNIDSLLSPDTEHSSSVEDSACKIYLQIPKSMYERLEKDIEETKGRNGVRTHGTLDIQLAPR